ncbi:MAG: formylglycine-generating enzyme family protein [Nitrosomonadales bacterium]|nr:formylglycine-generating enzyme family protein [Nitrosomonadales bacterium]
MRVRGCTLVQRANPHPQPLSLWERGVSPACLHRRLVDLTQGERSMKLKTKLTAALLAASLLLPTAQAAEPGGLNIQMISIPGRNYEIGKTEVTQAQWKAVMGNNPSKFKECGGNCPVENVSWDDARAFIDELNAQTGKNYRLPTEAEWEYACRAGGQHEEYCGNSLAGIAWYESNSDGHTHPVASKRANAWGLYDMSGNVWEWVQDWYDNSQKGRVLRGGSWFNDPQSSRAAYRFGLDPAVRDGDDGFRLARTLP